MIYLVVKNVSPVNSVISITRTIKRTLKRQYNYIYGVLNVVEVVQCKSWGGHCIHLYYGVFLSLKSCGVASLLKGDVIDSFSVKFLWWRENTQYCGNEYKTFLNLWSWLNCLSGFISPAYPYLHQSCDEQSWCSKGSQSLVMLNIFKFSMVVTFLLFPCDVFLPQSVQPYFFHFPFVFIDILHISWVWHGFVWWLDKH